MAGFSVGASAGGRGFITGGSLRTGRRGWMLQGRLTACLTTSTAFHYDKYKCQLYAASMLIWGLPLERGSGGGGGRGAEREGERTL